MVTATLGRTKRPIYALMSVRNDNLEQQAQALYKSWFVDFEPFKGGKFVDSELGPIPEGWSVVQISDVVDILSGYAFKSSTFIDNGTYRLVTIKAVQDGYLELLNADYIEDIPRKMPEFCILSPVDILLSLTGNVGRCCLVDADNLLLNQRVAKLRPKNSVDYGFVYSYFRKSETKNYLESIAKGTAQANLSPIETGKTKIVIAPRLVMGQFSVVINPLVESIVANKKESSKFTRLRDTLLPKLMSGELKPDQINL